MQVFLSRDETLDPRSDRLLQTIRLDEVVQAGQVVPLTLEPRMPTGISGPYYVIARVDPQRSFRPLGNVAESNESDNRTVSDDPILIELPPPTDLVVDSVSIDPSVVDSDGTVTVSWQVRNAGDTPARGIWDDSVYLSTDALLGFGDRLLGRTGVTTPTPNRTLQPGETYEASITTTLPPVLPSAYDVIVRTDVFDDIFEGPLRTNNDGVSTQRLQIRTPVLQLDVLETFEFDEANAIVYSIEVPAGETLEVTTDSEGASLELYAAFERVPTASSADGRFEGGLGGQQRALVPRTQGGTYYILIRGSAPNPVDVRARFLPLQITGLSTDRLGDSAYATVEVRGADFDPLATLKLARPGFDEHIPIDYEIVDATRIVATFDLTGAELGLYDVQVTNPDGESATVPHRLLVEPMTELDTDIGMTGPSLIGLGESGTYNVTAASLTNIDTPYVQWSIHVPRVENPEPTLIPGEAIRVTGNLGVDFPPFDTGQNIDPVAIIDGHYTSEAFIIDLPTNSIASSSFQVDIYPELPALLEEDPDFLRQLDPAFLQALSFDFYAQASVTPMSAEDYLEYQTEIARTARNRLLEEADLRDDIATAIGDESAWIDSYLVALRDAGLLRPQDVEPDLVINRQVVGALPILYTALSDGPFAEVFSTVADSGNLIDAETLASDLVALVRGIAGEDLESFGGRESPDLRQFDLESRLETRQVAFELRAGVPEEIGILPVDSPDLARFFVGTGASSETVSLVGPTGFGSQNMVPANTPLPFSVTVDQPINAGETVRELRIVQQIDPSLDIRTFQLSDLTLGDLTIDVPAGSAVYSDEIDFASDGFVLQVTAGVDANSATATWLLRAVNPDTGVLIEDPNVGFLRPGQTATAGYWVFAERDVPSGEVVETSARVFVGPSDAIDSDVYQLTLDTIAPTTTFDVTSLSGDRYRVDWSAVDDVEGSGVADHTVYVSRDGGSFLAIERRITDTSLVFQADPGESVRFVVLSSDEAGNVETAPAGIFVPAYNPAINLGNPPEVTSTTENPLPPPVPPADEPGSLVFRQLKDQIPSGSTPLRPSQFDTFFEPFVAQALVTGFAESGAGIGPMGVVVDPSEEAIWATGGRSRNELYRFDLQGGTLEDATRTYVLPVPVYDLVFDGQGRLWATTGGGALVSIDPASGAISDGGIASASRVTATLGLEVSPDGDRLFFATHDGISVLDLNNGNLSEFSGIRVDGLRFDGEGNLWATQWPSIAEPRPGIPGGGQVLRFNDRGIVVETIAMETPAEDLVFGPAGTPLEGLLIVSTEASVSGEPGDLIAIDLVSRQQTPMAIDGARGEFLAVHPDGTLYLTQTGQIDTFAPTAVPLVVSSTPVDGGATAPGTLRSTITFNVDMQTGDGGVDDPSVYRLIDTANGQTIPIGSATYDLVAKRVTLRHAPLATGTYELSIIGNVESLDGDALGTPFAAAFGVLADLTTSTDISVSRTQLNRRDGLVLFDATVTNQSDTALVGDLRLRLDGISDGDGVRILGAAADDQESVAFTLGQAGVPVGGSVTQTIIVANPLNEDLIFRNRVLATAAENQRPVITSTPATSIGLGNVFTYDAVATDADGPAPAIVLIEGPEGASIDPTTGQLTFDTSNASASESFRIRAIDQLGGFVDQEFTLDIVGGNQRPIIVSLDDVRLSEGDLLEVAIAAFDPEGDPVSVTMQNLPPGAFFDADRSQLIWQTTARSAGRYREVQVTADDGTSRSTSTIDIVVSNQNQPPVVSGLVDRVVAEGSELSFTIPASDPDGDELIYGARALPIGATINPSTGRFEWTPSFQQAGQYALDLEISDGELTTTVPLLIEVTAVNGQVQIADLSRRVIFEGQPIEVFIDAVDPDNPFAPPVVAPDGTFDVGSFDAPPLTFDLSGLPSSAQFFEEGQLIRWTPGFEDAGRYEIEITATDNGEDGQGPTFATTTLIIDVLDQNAAPVVPDITSQSVAADASLVVPVSATDSDGNPVSLSAGFADLIVGQLSPLPEFMSFIDNGDGTGELSVNPALTDRGDYSITITAADDGNGNPNNVQEGTFTFNVSVEVLNAPPMLNALPDVVAVVGEPFDLLISAEDGDQDPLSFVANGLPPAIALTNSPRYGESLLSFTPSVDDVGIYPITVDVTDSGNGIVGEELSDSFTFNLTIRSNNAPPSIVPSAIPEVAEGAQLSTTFEATDPDGDPLFFEAFGLPSGAMLDLLTGELTFEPGFDDAGIYDFELLVSDGSAFQVVSKSFGVTNVNRAPILTSVPPIGGLEGRELVVSFSANDPDQDPILVEVDQLPDGAAIVRGEGGLVTLRWPTEFGDAGNYELLVTATDPSGAVDTTTLTIELSNVNRRPAVVPTGGRVAVVGEELSIAIVADDPDGQDLTYTARNLPAGATLDSNSGVFQWTPTPLDIGDRTLLVDISDGESSVLEAIRIVVSQDAIPPQARVELTPSFPSVAGQEVILQPVGSGIAPIESVAVSVDGQSLPLDELGRARFIPSRPGRFEVIATATDVQGIVGTTTSAVLVRDPADSAPPAVNIDLDGLTVIDASQPVSIDVIDINLDSWKLSIQNRRGGDSIEVGMGTTAGTNLAAGELDAARFSPGVYDLTLTATDISGRTSTTSSAVVLKGDLSEVYQYQAIDTLLDFGDVSVPLVLQYRSSDASIDMGLGNGWSWSAIDSQPVVVTDVPVGSDNVPLRVGSQLHLIAPDGENVSFEFDVQQIDGTMRDGALYRPTWSSLDSGTWSLQSVDAVLTLADGGYYRVSDGLPYTIENLTNSPNAFTLSDATGNQFSYAATGALTAVSNASGHVDWFATEAVSSTDSRLTIRRDDLGRITSLVGLPGQSVQFRYDGDALLSVVDGVNRTIFDGDVRLTRVLSDQAGRSESVRYANNGTPEEIVSIDEFLGSLRAAAGVDVNGTVAADDDSTFGIVLSDSEVNSTNSGVVLIGISVEGVNGLNPTVPSLTGTTPQSVLQSATNSSALFALSSGGIRVATISGETDSTGDVIASFFIAGDLDEDRDVDGDDLATMQTQLGLTAGDPGFISAADINRDGLVNSIDVDLQAVNLGFVADLPPVASDVTVVTLPGQPIDIDLSNAVLDPEGSQIDLQVSGETFGTASLLADGKTVRFTPDGTDDGSFTFTATDLLGLSNPATATVTIETREVVSLRIETENVVIPIGGAASVEVVAILEDDSELVLPAGSIEYFASESIAVITASGTVGGLAAGDGFITATAFGQTAATSLRVAEPGEIPDTEVFPTNYALEIGQTRQFFVRQPLGNGDVVDLAADPGTFYIVSDPSVGTIDANGLFTAQATGQTEVTVVRDGQTFVTELLVAAPSLGSTVVDDEGGIVGTPDGSILVGVGPDTFDDPTVVTVTTLNESDLDAGIPAGFTFTSGVDIDLSGAIPQAAMSLAVPAPVSANVGDSLYVFRESQFFDVETGQFDTRFQFVDTMRVEADGVARTTSPPNNSLTGSGRYVTTFGAIGGLTGVLYGLALDAAAFAGRALFPVVEVDPDSGAPFFAYPTEYGDIFIPVPTSGYSISFRKIKPDLSTTKTVFDADFVPGTVTTRNVELDPPFGEFDGPTIEEATYGFENAEGSVSPVLTLTGEGFGSDIDAVRAVLLEDPFERPQAFELPSRIMKVLSVTDTEIRVQPLEGEVLSGKSVRIDVLEDQLDIDEAGDMLLTPQFVEGQGVEINLPTPYLSAAANRASDSLTIFDVRLTGDISASNQLPLAAYENSISTGTVLGGFNSIGGRVANTQLLNAIVANVSVGDGVTDVKITEDGQLAYATNTAEGTISIVDLLTLQEINRVTIRGFNPDIPTPVTFRPNRIAIHPTLSLAFFTDRDSASIGILQTDVTSDGIQYDVINLDPEGELLERIGQSGAITGLTDLAFSDDGRYLAINTPGRGVWYGNDVNALPGATILVELDELFAISAVNLGRPEIDFEKVNIVETGAKPFGIRYVGDNRFAVTARAQETTVIVDAKKANIANTIATRLRVAEGGFQSPGQFTGQRLDAARNLFGNLFSIDSPEDIAIATPLGEPITIASDGYEIRQLGFVLMNATFDGPGRASTNPDFGGGGNIGILANPLDDDARYIGATRKIPFSWPDQIDVGPDNDSLLATFTGIDAVLVYDISVIEATVAALAQFFPEALTQANLAIEDYAQLVARAPGPEQIGGDPEFASDVLLQEEREYFNEQKLRIGNGRAFRGGLSVGRLPSGLAPGPLAPPDIVGLVATYAEEGVPKPTITLQYTIFGDSAEPFEIKLYESGDRILNIGGDPTEDDVLIGTFEVTDPKNLLPRDHSIEIELDASLLDKIVPFHILHLDSSDTNPDEFSETNNFVNFRVSPFKFSAEFDGNDDPQIFGQYIEDVELINQFTYRAVKPNLGIQKVEMIVTKDGGDPDVTADVIRRIILTRLDGQVWQTAVDTSSWVGDPDIWVRTTNSKDQVDNELFQFDTIEQPEWFSNAPNIETTIKFVEDVDAYVITRLEEFDKFTYTFPEAVPALKGESIEFAYGAGIAFGFDLKGKASNQTIGPYYETTAFGARVDYPLSNNLFVGGDAATNPDAINRGNLDEFLELINSPVSISTLEDRYAQSSPLRPNIDSSLTARLEKGKNFNARVTGKDPIADAIGRASEQDNLLGTFVRDAIYDHKTEFAKSQGNPDPNRQQSFFGKAKTKIAERNFKKNRAKKVEKDDANLEKFFGAENKQRFRSTQQIVNKLSKNGTKGSGIVANKPSFGVTSSKSTIGISPLNIKDDLKLGAGGGISLDIDFPGIEINGTVSKTVFGLVVPPFPLPLANVDFFMAFRGALVPTLAYKYTVEPQTGGLFIPESSGIKVALRAELDLTIGVLTEVLLGYAGGVELGLTGKFSGNVYERPGNNQPNPVAFTMIGYGKGNVIGYGDFDLFNKVLFSATDLSDSTTYRTGALKYVPNQRPVMPLVGDDSQSWSNTLSESNSLWLPGDSLAYEDDLVTVPSLVGADADGRIIHSSEQPEQLALLASNDPFLYLGSTNEPIQSSATILAGEGPQLWRFHQTGEATEQHSVRVTPPDDTPIRVQLWGNDDSILRTVAGTGEQTISLEGITAGSYGVVVFTDGDVDVPVDVEITGPAIGIADLVADLNIIDDRLFAGQSLSVTYTVTNAGTVRSRPTRARIVASRDNDIDREDATLGDTQSIPALDPGERFTVTTGVTLGDVAGELVALGVWVDPYGTADQAVSDNDQYSRSVEVGLLPDVLEPNNQPSEAFHLMRLDNGQTVSELNLDRFADDDFHRFYHPGGDATIVVASNRSESAAEFQILGLDNAPIVRSGRPSTAEGGAIASASLSELPAGEYVLHVFGNSPTEYTVTLETDHEVDGPELIVQGLPNNLIAVAGTTLPLPLSVLNFGSKAGPITATLRAFDGDQVVGESISQLGQLDSNDFLDFDTSILINPDAAEKQLRLELTLETLNQDGDSETFSAESFISTAPPEDAFEIHELDNGFVRLESISGNDTVSGFRLSHSSDTDITVLELQSDPVLGSSIEVVSAFASDLHVTLFDYLGNPIDTIVDGDRRKFDLSNASGGPVTLQVFSLNPSDDQVIEYSISHDLPVASGANLRVLEVDNGSALVDSDSIELIVRVANTGLEDSSSTTLDVFLSENERIDLATESPVAAGVAVPALAVGEEALIPVTVDVTGVPQAGRYYLSALADSGESILESSESDNLSPSIGVLVVPEADALEPNNSAEQATPIQGNTTLTEIDNLTVHSGDVDLFTFELPSIGTDQDRITVEFDSVNGILEAYLFDQDGELIRTSDAFAEGVESSTTMDLVGLEAGVYFVGITPAGTDQFSDDYSISLRRQFSGQTNLRSDTPVGDVPTYDAIQSRLTTDRLDTLTEIAEERWDLPGQIPELTTRLADLPPGYLGLASITAWSGDGKPLAGTITVDIDADGAGWFIDDTPLDDSEFTRIYADGDAVGRPGESRYDLLTLLMHEIGHLAGFTDTFAGFASLITIDGNVATISTSDGDVVLAGDLDHVASSDRPFDLMNSTLRPGLRKLPSAANRDILLAAHEADYFGSNGNDELPLTSGGGFVSLSDGVSATVDAGPSVGLTNEDFQVGEPSDEDYGWRTVGDVEISDGVATIRETVGLIGDLSQTFVVPQGTTSIQFTLGGINLDVANGPFPSEAFEVSLLKSDDGSPVLGPVQGIDGGDALLNIQADGAVYFASNVEVEGLDASGGLLNLNEDIKVTIPVFDAQAGETWTIFFDLIGFDEPNSSVEVSDLEVDATPRTWTNPVNRFDVSDRDGVTALDALLVINQLARPTVHDPETRLLIEITDSVGPPPYYDVNSDGLVSALDALQVINQLARQSSQGEPESFDDALLAILDDDDSDEEQSEL
ncbi:MAG: putative Ig domain-containing protein [Planctomycetota bacterium]